MSKFENIKVAVAMATYNTNPEMLRQSIESILNQTHRNLIFYIVNDSGDNLAQLKDVTDKRVVIIEHNEKLGLAQSMNEIIDIAKEKYIFRMDADDVSLPDRLERQIEYMENNKHIDIASMFCKKIDSGKGFLYTMWTKSNDVKALLLFTNQLFHPSVVFRNSFLQKNHIKYDPSFLAAQDFDMWVRCSELTNISIIPRIGLLYRVHSNSITTKRFDIQRKFANKVREKNMQKLGFDNSYCKYLEMLCDSTLVDDFKIFSKSIVEIINSNKKFKTYNPDSIFNIISFFYLKTSVKTHNLMNAIRYDDMTRKLILNPNNLLTLVNKVRYLWNLNWQKAENVYFANQN